MAAAEPVAAPSRKERRRLVDATTVVLAALSVAAFAVVLWRSGAGSALGASREGLGLLVETLPRLLLAFVLAGLLQVLIPREVVARWLSDDAGATGIAVASVLGAFTPGGPFMQFPIVAAVYKMGAGTAPVVAYLTAWSLMGVHRIFLWELPFLGPRLTLTRLVVSLPFPFAAGLATRWVLRLLA